MNVIKPEISIVIVSFNVCEYLKKCIDSILRQQEIVSEIIVVDNNSSDNTVELLRERYPMVKLICNKINMGFSAANNQGIAEATGDIILLLNPDTELPKTDILLEMKKYLDANPGTGILAPCILNTDGSFQTSFWNFSGIKELLLELVYLHRRTHIKMPSSPIPVEGALGAALCFKRELIDEIGNLDETLFWMEDIDFCYRAYKAGRKTMYNPEIKIIHHGGKSSIEKYSITIPNQVMSKIKFFKKHGPYVKYLIFNFFSFIFILSRLIVFSLISISGNKIWRGKAKAYTETLKRYFNFHFRGQSEIIN